jgi:hypothetical protein
LPGGLQWHKDAKRRATARATHSRYDRPPPAHALPEPVYQFELPCGLILGLVRVGGAVRYGRYDRSSKAWRLTMSDWMREEIDFELDRLDRERAEAEEQP